MLLVLKIAVSLHDIGMTDEQADFEFKNKLVQNVADRLLLNLLDAEKEASFSMYSRENLAETSFPFARSQLKIL